MDRYLTCVLAVYCPCTQAAKKAAATCRAPRESADCEPLYGEEIHVEGKPKAAAKQKQKAAAESKGQQAQEEQQVVAVKQRQAQHNSTRAGRYPARDRNQTAKAVGYK